MADVKVHHGVSNFWPAKEALAWLQLYLTPHAYTGTDSSRRNGNNAHVSNMAQSRILWLFLVVSRTSSTCSITLDFHSSNTFSTLQEKMNISRKE